VVGTFTLSLGKFCPPMADNFRQFRDIVVKFLLDHPEQRHVGAASLGYAALSAVFPCR
jgi:hypothetical protein